MKRQRQQTVNPKRIVLRHFDSLINRIDIHTEEQLEKFRKSKLLGNPLSFYYKPDTDQRPDEEKNETYCVDPSENSTFGVEFCTDPYAPWYKYDQHASRWITPNSIRVRDYLNATRDELIEKLRIAQSEILKRYETIKNNLEFDECDDPNDECDDNQTIEAVKSKIFSDLFVGLFRIDIVQTSWQDYGCVKNPLPFKMFLLILDFYLKPDEQYLLRNFLDNCLTGFMYLGENQLWKLGNGGHEAPEFDSKCSPFNKLSLRAHMLKEYIFGLLDFQKYVHVLEVRKSDLFNVDKVGVSFDMKHTFSQCILDHHSTDFDNVKSLEIDSTPKDNRSSSSSQKSLLISSLACFSNLLCLKLANVNLTDSSLNNLTRLKRLELADCDFKHFKSESFRHVPEIEVLLVKEPRNYSHVDFAHLTKLRWLHVQNFSRFDFLDNLASHQLDVLEVTHSLDDSNAQEFFEHLNEQAGNYLKMLDVSNNRIENFDAKWLSKLKSLVCLRIDKLKKVNLNYEFLSSRLESLDLNSSQLEHSPSSSLELSKLVNLRSLDLSNVRGILLNSDSTIFATLSRLDKLRLKYVNPRSRIPYKLSASLLQGLSQLTVLNLYHNYLSEIDPEAFASTPNLQRLDLGSNRLNKLKRETFRHLGNLRCLDLATNEIKDDELEDGVFMHLKKLDLLSLHGNPIAKLRSALFHGLESLTKLDLYLVEAQRIDTNVLAGSASILPNLRMVRIDEYFRKKQPELSLDIFNGRGEKISFVFKS